MTDDTPPGFGLRIFALALVVTLVVLGFVLVIQALTLPAPPQAERVDALATSQDADIADALFAQASPEQATLLRSLPFFTLHPRIALRLRQHGVANLSLCDGSAGALAAMLAS